MTSPKLCAFCALLSLPFCLFGIIRLDSSFDGVTDQDYIDYGASFTSVGRVTGDAAGSGTLIASNWVLTAGHLGTDSSTFTINGVAYTVAQAIRHSSYDGSTYANDIMLLRLTTNVVGVTPSTYVSQGDLSYMGQTISFVGFGQGGTGDTTTRTSQGTKRGATNSSDALYGDYHFAFDFDNNTGTNNTMFTVGGVPSSQVPTALEGQVASGDSGGAAFYNDTIVGIGSFQSTIGDRDIGTYGNWSGYTRVDLYSDWITSVIPEPRDYAALLGVILLGLMITRRRLRLS